jgi:hypothetical protein
MTTSIDHVKQFPHYLVSTGGFAVQLPRKTPDHATDLSKLRHGCVTA